MISGDSNVANENESDKTTPVSKISSISTKSLVRKLKKNHDKLVLNADKNDSLNTTTTTTKATTLNNLNGNLNKNERSFANIQNIFSFKLKPYRETTRGVQKMEDDENFINLIELDEEEKASIDLNTNNNNNNNNNVSASNNKEKKKQIQFNIDPNLSTKTTDSKSFFGRRSSVHEKLNQLKVEAIKKRRLNAERKESLEKSKTEKKGFDFEKFYKKLEVIQLRLYYFLQRPTGLKGFIYRLFTFTIIFGAIISGALTTIKSLDEWSFRALFWYEVFANFYFTIELALRLWSCIHNIKYKNPNGRKRFLLRPMIQMEILVIVSSSLMLYFILTFKEKNDYFKPLTLLKFIQIFRFFYVDRKGQTWTLLIKVVSKHRFELLTSAYIGIIILLFSSYLILLVEKPYSDSNDDNHFHSYSDAVYWSIITMATIGYGDRSPRTFYGKIIATGLSIIGVAFWTLPSGIIGSGFALKVEQKNKKKQFNRLVPAAATLIQSWWRMKASLFLSSSNASCLVATIKTFDISQPIISKSLRRLKKNIESNTNEEISHYFVGLDSPVNKETSSTNELTTQQQNVIYRNQNSNLNGDVIQEGVVYTVQEKNNLINNEDTLTKNDIKFVNNYLSSHSSVGHSSNEETSLLLQLSPEHLILIRTILLLKFLASKQKFKLAFKPYDFKDVIEQYTQGNMDVLLKMKDLQRKIEKVYESLPQNRNLTNEYFYSSTSNCSGWSHSSRRSHNDYQMNENPSLNSSFKRQRYRSAGSGSEKRFAKSPSMDFAESFENEQNLFNRIDDVEEKLNELSKKFDKIIQHLEK